MRCDPPSLPDPRARRERCVRTLFRSNPRAFIAAGVDSSGLTGKSLHSGPERGPIRSPEPAEMTRSCPARLPRTCRRMLAACGVACALAGSGCKAFHKGGPSDPPSRVTDPLLGARIPPQNLPIPGKDGYAANERKDPLLKSGGGGDDKGARVSKPKPADNGVPSARIGSPKEPYLPGRETTTAALAAHVQPDDSALSIGDRRTDGRTTGTPKGPVPLRPVNPETSTAGGKTAEQFAKELRDLGAKLTPPVAERGQFVVRGDVPINPDNPGLVRRYEGAGPSAAAAMKDLLEQVRSDRPSS